MLKYKSGYFVPPAEVKRLKVMVVGWIIDDNNWEALKAYHLIGEGFEKEDMTFEEAADIIAKVQEQWMTKVQFLSASGRSAKVVDTCMINRKICGVRFGMFQPRDSIFVPREELDKLQNVDDDELQKAKVFLESRPEYGIRAESLNVVRSLIDEHCVTNAYIVEVLSEFEISGIEGRVVKSSEFAAKVIQLRFTGESAPSTYWFRDDADKFIENERNKFKVIKEKVSGLMPGRGEILDIVKPADLIVLLEKEKWLSPRDAVGLLNKDYNAVMRDIYSGKLPSVTVNLCGFHKRVFIPPTALAGTHVIDAPNKAIDKSV
jgi:hypothetical protein